MTRRQLVLHTFYGLFVVESFHSNRKKKLRNFSDAGAGHVCDQGDVYLNKIGEALVM